MNIIIILADDLGWSDVGFHGSFISTPTIDKMANEGIILDKFYANSICTPTRAELMTGRYACRYGLQQIIWPWNERGLSLKEKLLPELLKAQGYSTYAVGKWNLGHYSKKFLPRARGFDFHYGSYTGCTSHYEHKYHGVHDFHENGKPIYPKGHLCDLQTNKVIEIIKKHDKNKPLFIYLAFNSPHLPLEPTAYWNEKYQNIKNTTKRKYAAMVSHMDDSINKIIESLKEKNIYEDTLIWFMSDNGGWTEQNCGGENFPFKGGKISFYEGGIRVTSIIKWKNLKKKIDSPIHVTDILPTLCSMTGIDLSNKNIDGFDISKIILEDLKIKERTIIHHLQKNNLDFIGCITKNNFKILKFKEIELYNIKIDPFEKNNIANTNTNILKELLDEMKKLSEGEVIPDPIGIYNKKNGGPPDNYVFPKYWGELSPIKMLGYKEIKNKKSIKKLSCKEALGYPDDWEPK